MIYSISSDRRGLYSTILKVKKNRFNFLCIVEVLPGLFFLLLAWFCWVRLSGKGLVRRRAFIFILDSYRRGFIFFFTMEKFTGFFGEKMSLKDVWIALLNRW